MVTFVPNAAGFAFEFKTPQGIVGRDMQKRGLQLLRLGVRQAGKRTGFLRLSMHSRLGRWGAGDISVTVGSSAAHALMHHEGTRPHLIMPRHSSALRFTQNGRVVFARRVMHPGTRPNRYLTDNLARVVLS